jgi:hypothetical protein
MLVVARSIAAALLALLVACSALGQAAGEARPRFFVDSIEVSGLRYASERVIVAETRLTVGREYTEAELRAGAARAARLPFVVNVDLRLERGEQRGAYRLVLEVIEARPVFGGATLLAGGDDRDDLRQANAGARLFLGRSGVVHAAAIAGDDAGFEAGYTQYDLFGSGVFAAAIFEYRDIKYRGGEPPPEPFYEPPGTLERLTTHLVAGVPIAGDHAVRASWTREPTVVRGLLPDIPGITFHTRYITTTELTYLYDSTDDPLFPTRGLSVTGSAARRRGPYVSVAPLGPPRLTYYERPSFSVEARKHWEVAPRHSLWAEGAQRHVERDVSELSSIGLFERRTATSDETEIGAGYALTLWGDYKPNGFGGDLRVEGGVGYRSLRHAIPQPLTDELLRTSESTPTAHVGLVFRNSWTVIRLRFEVGE